MLAHTRVFIKRATWTLSAVASFCSTVAVMSQTIVTVHVDSRVHMSLVSASAVQRLCRFAHAACAEPRSICCASGVGAIALPPANSRAPHYWCQWRAYNSISAFVMAESLSGFHGQTC